MAVLENMRKGASQILGLTLIGLLVVSFAVWGIADIFTGYGGQTLIRVGDTEITPQDYQRAQQEILRSMSGQAGRSLSLQEARALGLDDRVMERLIGGAAVDSHAKDLGLGITEEVLFQSITTDPAFQDSAGNFSPLAFAQTLRNIGMTEQGYLAAMRDNNLRRQLLTTVGDIPGGPEVLVVALNRYNGETRVLRYVLVPQSAAGEIPNPTDEDLKRYYENQRAKFTQPEYRKVGVLAVTPDTVRDKVTITEADLKAAYESDKDKLGNPEKRTVQQIVFPDLDAAKAAREKIVAGTDFMEVAKAQGLSETDVNLGNVTRGELADAVIAEEAFKLEKDKVSEPVTGKLGSIVLLRVTAIEEGKTPTFEEAKADLEKKILKERAATFIFDLHDKVEDELASGAQLSEIADKLKLNYQVIDQVDRVGKKPDGSTVTLPAQKEVLNAVFATDAGVENDAIDAKDEGVIWYEVLGVTPEQLKPFDQVKAEVETGWRAEEARNRVAKYAQELVSSLNAGKTLEDIAKDLNVEVMTSDALKRDGMTVNILPATVAQAFTLPEGGFGAAPSGIDEGRVVFKVDKVTAPAPVDEQTSKRLKQQLALLMGEDAISEYFQALEGRYGVTINQQALDKLIGTGEEP